MPINISSVRSLFNDRVNCGICCLISVSSSLTEYVPCGIIIFLDDSL